MPIEAPYLHLRDDEDDTSRKSSQYHDHDHEEVDDDMPVFGDGLFPVGTDIQRRKEARKTKQVGRLVSSIPPKLR